jgi:hypothetical protein
VAISDANPPAPMYVRICLRILLNFISMRYLSVIQKNTLQNSKPARFARNSVEHGMQSRLGDRVPRPEVSGQLDYDNGSCELQAHIAHSTLISLACVCFRVAHTNTIMVLE